MEPINIAICTGIEKDLQRRIAAVDPRVRVWNIADLLRTELRLAAQGKEPDYVPLDARLCEAEIMLLLRSPARLFDRAPRLRWVQLASAGVDHGARAGLLEGEVIITNASGIHATPIGEYVLGTVLMFARRALRSFRQQREKHWERFPTAEVRGKTMGIIGLGNIGNEVARLARAFGMRVVATRRSAVRRQSGVDGVDLVYPAAGLPQLLAEADFVVLSLPLTPETKALIGEDELRAMKPSAYLINISRGAVVDEEALVVALREGWIAGAGLDVFAREPLPADSELWELPNAIVTSHIAGLSELYNQRLVDLFCDNLQRYLAGQPLRNVVDKMLAY